MICTALISVYHWDVLYHVRFFANIFKLVDHKKNSWGHNRLLLDDFIFVGHSASVYKDIRSTYNSIYHELGIPLAEHKTVDPTTGLTFLGLEVDTIEMLVRVINQE